MRDVKVAIAGAGMAGAYLYRLLREQGFGEVDLFDLDKSTRCGHRPCGWGFAPSSDYRRLVSRFIDADDLVLGHQDEISIDGLGMSADLIVADKPRLVRSMLGDAVVRRGKIDLERYDRVIDATGVERAYIGPAEHPELIADLVQYRVSTPKDLGTWISTDSIGYEWCFPLGRNEYHLGFGDLRSGAGEHDLLHYLDGVEHSVQCRCHSKLRLSSPFYSRPLTNGNVIGVGESVGTVAPMGGDGNLYSMECAQMLVDHWDDVDGYVEAVLERYEWMKREREALERLMDGKFPTMGDMRTFLQHAQRVGFGMGPVNALRFFTKALQTDRGSMGPDRGAVVSVRR